LGVAVLPPAFCGPYFVWSSEACSIFTASHGTSSSSAMSIGSAVFTPCPISGFLAMIVTTLSGVILTKAFGRKTGAGPCGAWAKSSATGSSCMATSMPPPASALIFRKARRSRRGEVLVMMAAPYSLPVAMLAVCTGRVALAAL
jgi:hypothetical protein